MKPPLISKHITDILTYLPSSPGVYQMFDTDQHCIYVGKAKDLKKRVSSYFQNSKNHAIKVRKMVEQIHTISYTEVSSELEALILESNFIKELKPKYNILLRDDKHYCYIKIHTNEDYPRITVVRKVLDDHALYFGPKTSSSGVYETLKVVRKLFPYRSCDLEIEDRGNTVQVSNRTIQYPCLYYHIKRCIAPCIIPCKTDYAEIINAVADFLRGNHQHITSQLELKLKQEAAEKQFERAIKTRDLLKMIYSLLEKQIIDQAETLSQDVIHYTCKFGHMFIILLQVRHGKIIGKEVFEYKLPNGDDLTEEETHALLERFLWEYYSLCTELPREIMFPIESPQMCELMILLAKERHSTFTPKFIIPKRGIKYKLLDLAKTNAESHASQKKALWLSEHSRTQGAAKDLQHVLGLEQELHRIECYDISHLGGTHTVASMVVFKDGQPSKKDYRRFKIESLSEGQIDDFASMKEILERRFHYIKNKEESKESFSEEPNLIIIDGGKGQLSSVMEIAEQLQITIPIISLAKREEEIFFPDQSDPLLLPRDSFALYLLQNIRDEAHRFAISFNRNLRHKNQTKSRLDTIKGIGPKTKKLLLKEFGDINGILTADDEKLISIIGEKKTTILRTSLS